MKVFARVISTIFGIGYLPAFPGTVASAVTVLIYYFFLHSFHWILYISFLLLIFFLGVYSSYIIQKDSDEEDPSKIVIDEVGGQMAALFLVPSRMLYLVLAFLIFRFIDIVKPFSLKKIELLPGGWGVMVDDLVAGIITALIVHFILIFT